MNEIDTRHHQEIWTLVNRLRQMRFHLTCLAHGARGDVGVWHRASVKEIYMDITVYTFRYHRSLPLPPVTIERDPSYAESLQECIVGHMHLHEVDLFEQMLNLLHLMHDELWLRQPGRGDDACRIITWLLCEQINELLTYMDIGGIKKVRAAGGLEIRCCAESDAGRLLQARLRKEAHVGKLSLWDKPVGTWRYHGMSIGALVISLEGLPDRITHLPHWSALRPHMSLESSACVDLEVLR